MVQRMLQPGTTLPRPSLLLLLPLPLFLSLSLFASSDRLLRVAGPESRVRLTTPMGWLAKDRFDRPE
ncbi:hypothetical protein CEXT_740591 [Caerostris extrusa]|uniref:Uncharacterized protein n=1 Tax=Caerostris extrusa TaxID=172846 RepID=A0AAV4YCJ7_CAEEX|nr:hypothetical protein CEXT_740591 [Caerostris extrusa]